MDNYITVFTPTYNRMEKLPILYESLVEQSCKKFEWIVVDDGSSDGTEKFFDNLPKCDFPVRYYKTKNGGKHRAINLGVQKAEGDFFFIVDSDDKITSDAIETIYSWLSVLPQEYAAVSGLRGFSEGEPMGNIDCFSKKIYIDCTNIERHKIMSIWDMAEVYRVSVLKKYPFPEFENENFLTEGVVWNRIASDGYKIRWYGKIIYICKYLEGGLTRSGKKKFINNPKGYSLAIWQEIHYFPHTIKEKIVIYYEFYNNLKGRMSLYEISKLVKINYLLYWCIIVVMDFRHPDKKNSEETEHE